MFTKKHNFVISTDCAITLTNPNGFVTSPGYPHNNYPDLTDCTWLIQLSPGQIIEISFIRIKFEEQGYVKLIMFDQNILNWIFHSLVMITQKYLMEIQTQPLLLQNGVGMEEDKKMKFSNAMEI